MIEYIHNYIQTNLVHSTAVLEEIVAALEY